MRISRKGHLENCLFQYIGTNKKDSGFAILKYFFVVIIRFYLKNSGSVCKKIMSCLSAASPSASTAILPTI